MFKRLLSIIMIITIIPFALFGCNETEEIYDPSVINDSSISIGVLIPDKDPSADHFLAGIDYASKLADSVYINDESVSFHVNTCYYTPENIVQQAQSLVSERISAIIFCGDNLESFNDFADYIKGTGIPVISLSPYRCDYKRFYSLTLSAEYKSSCAATYALDKEYNNCAVLCESDDEYYQNFAEVFNNTFKSYTGTTPEIYYKNGELKNFTDSALISGGYDYLILLCPSDTRTDTVNYLRSIGFIGEILFDETFDHTESDFSELNNCSFITKFENDPTNNISTVFLSEYKNTQTNPVTSATAYGYDAYMTIFEAFKSFSTDSSSSIFKTETVATTAAYSDTEITLSEFIKALENVVYHGVTDTIKFKDNSAVPTYIYVDNIVNSEIILCKKYTFTDK